jgi:hypothetical protein
MKTIKLEIEGPMWHKTFPHEVHVGFYRTNAYAYCGIIRDAFPYFWRDF